MSLVHVHEHLSEKREEEEEETEEYFPGKINIPTYLEYISGSLKTARSAKAEVKSQILQFLRPRERHTTATADVCGILRSQVRRI